MKWRLFLAIFAIGLALLVIYQIFYPSDVSLSPSYQINPLIPSSWGSRVPSSSFGSNPIGVVECDLTREPPIQCPSDLTCCDKKCKNTVTDGSNCGGCGNICGVGKTCQSGVCSCPAGQDPCGALGSCVDRQTDPFFCGGTSCADTKNCHFSTPRNEYFRECVDGQCGCPNGQELCDSVTPGIWICTDYTTNLNCGMCGRKCLPPLNCRVLEGFGGTYGCQ